MANEKTKLVNNDDATSTPAKKTTFGALVFRLLIDDFLSKYMVMSSLNIASYLTTNSLIVLDCLDWLHLVSSQNESLRWLSAYAAFLTNIGTLSYGYGVIFDFKAVKNDSPAEGDTLPPFRMSGANMRYLGMNVVHGLGVY
ncbi:predicted protein [Thalassiosira pseudonana CCMP1335]|jgi:hypothetical protein|uniref:Uncharacterized protein n=1 Tax=Thalassiosira pseudonana TaxID=35128 RepID=B8LEP7_THAPS|nr:predicted protein [Thalassiosira pseudonana CCMP1335]XP_002297505.1 predicted protein [Thalassiosira pseudonana CCMP1335]EED86196.1 predicted protein [Thalassiosira pseudonana CCMP1335]EED86203.1 predicted protein [Thalassiosira pseudonana CCMP1335]